VTVHIEVGAIPMLAFAHVIRQPTDGQNVAGAVKGEGIASAKAFAGEHFLMDRE
jgi:hypothetical protein